MSKRRADVELNQDNWDDDTTVQKSQPFEKADKDSLAARKIISISGARSSKTGTSGIFKSFTGFSSPNGVPIKFNFGSTTNGCVTSAPTVLPVTSVSSEKTTDGRIDQEAEYLRQLLTLNRNLLDWIEKHIKEDPYCILTPVFSDYEKHLRSLHVKFPDHNTHLDIEPSKELKSTNKSSLLGANDNKDIQTPTPFSSVLKDPAESNTSTKQLVDAPAKPFSFNLPPIAGTISAPLFKFGPLAPSSSPFPTSLSTPSSTPTNMNEEQGKQKYRLTFVLDNEEYHPPKPEVREIKEEGSVYNIRCKLFYKLDAEWRERGVGNLFIKPTTSEKFQLLIRADTNLGNILLNILITRDIPFKRQKNNLTFVCVPTPPLPVFGKQTKEQEQTDSSKPVPMLIRVKSEDNAIELLHKIDQHRGLSNSS
ncbi:Nuclear pore complex protein nup50 [Fasciolopsis buskii]|uniref:Nuclear pore complex protein nup50 n=1 Tax=Fasciolopsis buskii TaxID=27845 RepID=A0A8E0RRV6_9TREM|nr:Nuclear pore complex protein nup50 [Fasciolopsis buski]